MKGTLKNKEGKWVVEYWDKLLPPNEARSILYELSLYPDNVHNANYAEKYGWYHAQEVEFEIVFNCKLDGDTLCCLSCPKVAKLISKQEELPNESFNMLMKGSEQESWDEIETMLKSYISFSDLFEIMQEIKKKYNPPTKK